MIKAIVLNIVFLVAVALGQTLSHDSLKAQADSLHVLGSNLVKAGKFDSAQVVLRSEVKLREVLLDSVELVNGLNSLCGALAQGAKFEEGLVVGERALTICKPTVGEEDTLVARSLQNIGNIYWSLGNYEKALDNYNKALTIRLKILGPDHPDVARNYSNIGVIDCKLGDFEKALENYDKALAIQLKALGPDHPDVATSYDNIGVVYYHLGNYEKTLEYYNKALIIQLKALGPDHPDVAWIYNNIGFVYNDRGDYAKALENYNRALSIRLKTLGPDHPDVAASYNNIGVVYYNLADYEKALENYSKVLAIRLKTLGPDHPDVAASYSDMGNVYDGRGDYEKALENHYKALAIRLKALGPDHPDVAASYQGIASAFFKKGNYDSALVYAAKSTEVFDKIQKAAFYVLAEKGALGMGEQYDPYPLATLIYLRLNNPAKAYETWIRGRGRALYALTERNQRAVKSEAGKELWETRATLLTKCATLYNQLELTRDSLKLKNLKGLFQSARDSLEAVENSLTKQSRLFGEIFEIPKITSEEIIAQLPPHSTLIEYAVLDEGLYGFVIRRNAGAAGNAVTARQFVKKEGIRDFEKELTAYRTVLTTTGEMMEPMFEQASGARLSAQDRQMLEDRYHQSDSLGRDLYATLVGQLGLKPDTTSGQRLIIIPDGILNFLPFEALVDKDGTYLLEKYEVSYLNAARELMRRSEERVVRGELLAYGAPNYDADSVTLRSGMAKPGSTQEAVAMRSARGSCVQGLKWDYLAGTKDEVASIRSIMGGTVRLGNEATEAMFKQDAGNAGGRNRTTRYIHLATHGYFSDCPSARKAAGFSDPMSNSGIVFAGANAGGDGYDDGFLTALEVLGLDLTNTELVTLSCCESGLGELKGSEGVFGLKRSFLAAGARSLLLSLWPVSDYWTKELMVKFYANLKHGKAKSEALREAKLDIMKNLKDSYGFSHPFFWSPFILIGDWR